MVLSRSVCERWIAFMACLFFVRKALTECCSRELTLNFGETSKMICGVSNSSKEVVWLIYGKRITNTTKTMLSTRYLHISCLESSDSGEYICEDKVTSTYIDSYRLIVKNPENMTYFHIYNQAHQKCVMRIGKQLSVAFCDLNQCAQKWGWIRGQKIISGLGQENSECVSVDQRLTFTKVIMESCHSNTSFQGWECKDGDLLSIQGQELYFNFGQHGTDIVLYTGSGSYSRWVKLSTGRSLCDKDYSSRKLRYNFGETSKMSCGKEDSTRAVSWFKYGKRISETPKTHFFQGILYIYCLESSDSGEYVCKDKVTLSFIDSHSLTVKNPGNRTYFHIYNQHHKQCISKTGNRIFVELCDLNKCAQKWSWTPCQQIISAVEHENPECISFEQPVNMQNVVMDSCKSNTSFEKWECKDGDLLSVQGKELYLNYGNKGGDVVLYTGNGLWSRWIDLSTGQPLCDKDFSVDETCCNNATAICIEQHWFPSLLNRSTQNNRMDVDTPTIRHLSTIQVPRVTGKIKTTWISKTPAKKSNIGIITGSIVAVITVLVLFLVGFFLFKRMKRNQQFLTSFQESHQITRPLNLYSSTENIHSATTSLQTTLIENQEEISYIQLVDHWEIRRENLTILEKQLGSGQFGVVKQGLIFRGKNESEVIAVKMLKDASMRYFENRRGDSEIVAVKMLKDGATAADKSDLLSELKILKEVNTEPHPNVLELIGACSTSEPILVVTEYCSRGNLRKFLINSRVETEDSFQLCINQSSTLTNRKLVKLAIDVASGMIHLSSQKFVHRDLAARNILIGENGTAKVSDFGLARDIKDTEVYFRSNQNLLPLKWMALESLLDDRFTTSSDIWSFGVLLYEIITLGDEPYKGMPSYNIVSRVGSGYRMGKPSQCPEKLYTLMINCWKVNPGERPSFEAIHDALNNMLTDDEHSLIEENLMQ